MSELICLAFDGATHADHALVDLQQLYEGASFDLANAAVVIYGGDGKSLIRQSTILSPSGYVSARRSAVWPSLISLLFQHPLTNLLPRASASAGGAVETLCAEHFQERFFRDLGSAITPGGSALFVLATTPSFGRLIDKLVSRCDGPVKVVRAGLSPAGLISLRQLLCDDSGLPTNGSSKDPVDQASDDGFPASDPPSFVPGTPGRSD